MIYKVRLQKLITCTAKYEASQVRTRINEVQKEIGQLKKVCAAQSPLSHTQLQLSLRFPLFLVISFYSQIFTRCRSDIF